jgi:Mn2+/Fe2+ NRAMP family transporter
LRHVKEIRPLECFLEPIMVINAALTVTDSIFETPATWKVIFLHLFPPGKG